jgi:hypothetical protein
VTQLLVEGLERVPADVCLAFVPDEVLVRGVRPRKHVRQERDHDLRHGTFVCTSQVIRRLRRLLADEAEWAV